MLVTRKKANTIFNIFLTWKKAGLILFDPNSVLKTFLKIKKYISED